MCIRDSGYLLFEHLANAGITCRGKLSERALDINWHFEKFAEYQTPIADCLERCNKNSLGLAAEALVKTIAAQSQEGKEGSWRLGTELISKYLGGLGVPREEFYIDDGSGLSRKNRLSPNAITKVLYSVYKSGNWKLYRSSLAVGGVDGTIRKYFKETAYKGRILGKTGYIDGVKSFSGVCAGKNGNYLFSIIANGANARTRPVINDIAKAILDEADK